MMSPGKSSTGDVETPAPCGESGPGCRWNFGSSSDPWTAPGLPPLVNPCPGLQASPGPLETPRPQRVPVLPVPAAGLRPWASARLRIRVIYQGAGHRNAVRRSSCLSRKLPKPICVLIPRPVDLTIIVSRVSQVLEFRNYQGEGLKHYSVVQLQRRAISNLTVTHHVVKDPHHCKS